MISDKKKQDLIKKEFVSKLANTVNKISYMAELGLNLEKI